MATNYNHFTKNERNELSILLKKGYSQRSIAATLGKSPPSIGREIKRNTANGEYDPQKANHKAYVKRKYSKYQGMKIAGNRWLEAYIKEKLVRSWTPEEIAGRLNAEHDRTLITFKSIYKWLYSPTGQPWCKYLLCKRYQPRKDFKKTARILIPNRTSIDVRPNVINLRKRYGDFEGDTLGTPRRSAQILAGVVDRKSRYFQARKMPGLKHAMSGFKELSDSLRARSFTFDNGVENIHHQTLGIPTYFCNPHAAWEKGSMENTFQRLRRFIPKKASVDDYSDEEIAKICDIMNDTPRKCLAFRTPREVFGEHLTRPMNTHQFIKNILSKCCS